MNRLQPDAKNPQSIKTLFNRIAKSYDRLNNVFSLGFHRKWKRRLIKEALSMVANPHFVLDAATGTGDLAFFAEKALAARKIESSILAVDFSTNMLEIAKQKASKKRSNVGFKQLDLMKTPWQVPPCDLITIGFGLRNVADRDLFFENAANALTAQGVLGILEFGKVPKNLFQRIYEKTVQKWMPRLGARLSGEPSSYAYLVDSSLRFPSGTQLSNEASRFSLRCLKYEPLCFGLVHLYLFGKEA